MTPTILVVDDQDVLRRLVQRMLMQAGYAVLTAGSGAEALEMIEARHGAYDVLVTDASLRTHTSVAALLTDVRMPDMHGCTLATEVMRRWSDIRVLFMSGYPEEVLAMKGCPRHLPLLVKPFMVDELLARMAQTLTDPPWHPENER